MKYLKYIYNFTPKTIFGLIKRFIPLKIIDNLPNDIIEYLNLSNLEFHELYRNYKMKMVYNKDKNDYYSWLLNNEYYFFDLCKWHLKEKNSFLIEYFCQLFNLKWKNLDILDFGSGIGTRSLILAKKNYLTLVEINIKLLDFSKWRFKKYNRNAEFFTKIPLDRKYDMVMIIDVIGHLTKPIETIENICSVLKKKGLLYITFDNFNYTIQDTLHRNKEINFNELLQKNGLTRIKSNYYKKI